MVLKFEEGPAEGTGKASTPQATELLRTSLQQNLSVFMKQLEPGRPLPAGINQGQQVELRHRLEEAGRTLDKGEVEQGYALAKPVMQFLEVKRLLDTPPATLAREVVQELNGVAEQAYTHLQVGTPARSEKAGEMLRAAFQLLYVHTGLSRAGTAMSEEVRQQAIEITGVARSFFDHEEYQRAYRLGMLLTDRMTIESERKAVESLEAAVVRMKDTPDVTGLAIFQENGRFSERKFYDRTGVSYSDYENENTQIHGLGLVLQKKAEGLRTQLDLAVTGLNAAIDQEAEGKDGRKQRAQAYAAFQDYQKSGGEWERLMQANESRRGVGDQEQRLAKAKLDPDLEPERSRTKKLLGELGRQATEAFFAYAIGDLERGDALAQKEFASTYKKLEIQTGRIEQGMRKHEVEQGLENWIGTAADEVEIAVTGALPYLEMAVREIEGLGASPAARDIQSRVKQMQEILKRNMDDPTVAALSQAAMPYLQAYTEMYHDRQRIFELREQLRSDVAAGGIEIFKGSAQQITDQVGFRNPAAQQRWEEFVSLYERDVNRARSLADQLHDNSTVLDTYQGLQKMEADIRGQQAATQKQFEKIKIRRYEAIAVGVGVGALVTAGTFGLGTGAGIAGGSAVGTAIMGTLAVGGGALSGFGAYARYFQWKAAEERGARPEEISKYRMAFTDQIALSGVMAAAGWLGMAGHALKLEQAGKLAAALGTEVVQVGERGTLALLTLEGTHSTYEQIKEGRTGMALVTGAMTALPFAMGGMLKILEAQAARTAQQQHLEARLARLIPREEVARRTEAMREAAASTAVGVVVAQRAAAASAPIAESHPGAVFHDRTIREVVNRNPQIINEMDVRNAPVQRTQPVRPEQIVSEEPLRPVAEAEPGAGAVERTQPVTPATINEEVRRVREVYQRYRMAKKQGTIPLLTSEDRALVRNIEKRMQQRRPAQLDETVREVVRAERKAMPLDTHVVQEGQIVSQQTQIRTGEGEPIPLTRVKQEEPIPLTEVKRKAPAATEAVPVAEVAAGVETRQARLEQQFHENYWKTHSEKDVAKATADGYVEVLHNSHETREYAPALIALRKAKPEVQQRVKADVMRQLEGRLSSQELDSFANTFDAYMKTGGWYERVASYRPTVELGEVASDLEQLGSARRGRVLPGNLERLREQVLEVGTQSADANKTVLAHGTGDGGMDGLLNVMLGGDLEKAYYGSLNNQRTGSMAAGVETSAGYKGPYYILLDPAHPSMRQTRYVPPGEDVHLAYLVPAAEDRNVIVKALEAAQKKGLIGIEEKNRLIEKVITYDEFLRMQKADQNAFRNPQAFRQAYVTVKTESLAGPEGAAGAERSAADAMREGATKREFSPSPKPRQPDQQLPVEPRTVSELGLAKTVPASERTTAELARPQVSAAPAAAVRLSAEEQRLQEQAQILLRGGFKKERMQEFLGLDDAMQRSVIETMDKLTSPELKGGTPAFYRELYAVQQLEQRRGLRPGALTDGYANATSVGVARAKLMENLGIQMESPQLINHTPLFSILTSGDMQRRIAELPEMASGTVTRIGYRDGAVGAYEVTVRVGKQEKVLFLKQQDLKPDLAGARELEIAGIPTSRITTETKNGPLEYVDLYGNEKRYGFSHHIKDIEQMTVAGRKIQIKVTNSESVKDMYMNPEFTEFYARHPDRVYHEIGYLHQASMTSGMWDRSANNSWMLMLEVSQEDAKFLAKQGYMVMKEEGKFKVFTMGAIDTDSSGQFLARTLPNGELNTGGIEAQYGYWDWMRISHSLAKARRLHARRQGKPETATAQQVLGEAFGRSDNGPAVRGAERWWKNVGSTEEYQGRMVEQARSQEGQARGWGFALDDKQKLDLQRQGQAFHPAHWNGFETTPIDFPDGRFRFVADGVRADGQRAGWVPAFERFLGPIEQRNGVRQLWGRVRQTAEHSLAENPESAKMAKWAAGEGPSK